MRNIMKEFREFAMQGSAVEMAVGIILGAGFKDVVESFVQYVLLPPVGLLLGNTDFSHLFISLSGTQYPSLEAAMVAGAPVIAYGLFLNNLIEFLILAWVVFLVIRQMNRMRNKEKSE